MLLYLKEESPLKLSEITSLQDFKTIPSKELPQLAQEIREKIIETTRANGGHLASNLGVVELTMAIHHVFDIPDDMLVFDVGHQCYTHKLLTGRYSEFDNIRLESGISGFLRREESEYDMVDSGHASSSISQVAGFAQAARLKGKANKSIAVIGDGALSGGVAFEGLNFCANEKLPVLIIINDNEMSIDKNVNPINKYINRLAVSNFYHTLYRCMHKGLHFRFLQRLLYWTDRVVKAVFNFDNIFTNMGFDYVGPVDGHNIDELIYIFNHAKRHVTKPIVVHVKTVKGRGFKPAEDNPSFYHGVSPNFDKPKSKRKSFTSVFSEKILSMAIQHSDIVAVTAAMESGTGLSSFHECFPNRFFDVGIAEQHAVSFASTMAYAGFCPVVAIYSTFLMRAIDQICQDVCISRAPVIFMVDRAGIVGADGETHNGQFDISYLRMLPNISILAPCDAMELRLMLEWAYEQNNPVAIRYPRGVAVESQFDESMNHLPVEGCFMQHLREACDVLVIATGVFVDIALEAAQVSDIDCGVLYLRLIKPLQGKVLFDIISGYKKVVVVEENSFAGSVSEEIATLIAINKSRIQFDSINIPNGFVCHGERESILKRLGFSVEGILSKLS